MLLAGKSAVAAAFCCPRRQTMRGRGWSASLRARASNLVHCGALHIAHVGRKPYLCKTIAVHQGRSAHLATDRSLPPPPRPWFAGKKDKAGQQVNVWTNFRDYGLPAPLGLLRCDLHTAPFRWALSGVCAKLNAGKVACKILSLPPSTVLALRPRFPAQCCPGGLSGVQAPYIYSAAEMA